MGRIRGRSGGAHPGLLATARRRAPARLSDCRRARTSIHESIRASLPAWRDEPCGDDHSALSPIPSHGRPACTARHGLGLHADGRRLAARAVATAQMPVDSAERAPCCSSHYHVQVIRPHTVHRGHGCGPCRPRAVALAVEAVRTGGFVRCSARTRGGLACPGERGRVAAGKAVAAESGSSPGVAPTEQQRADGCVKPTLSDTHRRGAVRQGRGRAEGGMVRMRRGVTHAHIHVRTSVGTHTAARRWTTGLRAWKGWCLVRACERARRRGPEISCGCVIVTRAGMVTITRDAGAMARRRDIFLAGRIVHALACAPCAGSALSWHAATRRCGGRAGLLSGA